MSSAIARNSALHVGAKILGMLIGFFTFLLLLHGYGKEQFGVLTAALTFIGVVAALVDFGFTLSATQMISRPGAQEERILGNLLTLRVCSAVVLLGAAPFALLWSVRADEIFPLALLCAASALSGAVAQSFVGVFQKRLEIATAAAAEVAGRVTALLGVSVGVALHLPLVAAPAAFALGALLQLCIVLLGVHRRVALRPRWELAIWKEILAFSWPIGVSIFFNLLYLKGDIALLWLLGQPDGDIGEYGAAYRIIDVLTVIPVTVMGMVLPILTARWSGGDRAGFCQAYQRVLDMLAVIAIPIGVGGVVGGNLIMEILRVADPDLVLVGRLLMILAPAVTVIFFGALSGHAIVALGRQRAMVWGYGVAAAVGLAGYLLTIPRFGVWGAAWTTLASELCIMVLTTLVVARATGGLPQFGMMARALCASVPMALFLLLPLPPIVAVLGAIPVYGIALALLGGPTPRTMLQMLRVQ